MRADNSRGIPLYSFGMSEQVWVVRAGQDAIYVEDFLTRHMVAIGWEVIGDLKAVHGREQIAKLLKTHFPEYNKF